MGPWSHSNNPYLQEHLDGQDVDVANVVGVGKGIRLLERDDIKQSVIVHPAALIEAVGVIDTDAGLAVNR